MTPMNYGNVAQIDFARCYLESTDMGFKDIAQRCGLESAETLRRILFVDLVLHL